MTSRLSSSTYARFRVVQYIHCFAHQDGSLQNGDHLLAVGEVRLWGMGAEQVAAILRQAGQESIRLVVARPIDPSEPNYLINSAIVPTKVLSDPMELERTLQSGLLQSAAAAAAAVGNGFDFNQQAAIAAVAAAAAVEANVNGDAVSTPPAVTVTGVTDATPHDSPLMHNVPLPLTPAAIPNGPVDVVERQPHHPCIVTTDATQPSGASTDIIVPTSSSTTTGTPSPQPPSPVSPTQSSSTTTICEADVHHQEGGGEPRAPSSSGTSCMSSTVNEVTTAAKTPAATRHRARRKASSLRRAAVVSENNSAASSSSAEGTKLVRKSSVPSSMLLGHNPVVDKAKPKPKEPHEDAIDVVVVVEESSEEAEKKRGGGGSSVKKRQGSLRSKKTKTKMVKCTEEMEKEMMGAVLPEKEEYKIELFKDHAGLGITVAGYVCEKEDLCGIFVKNVIDGSSADKSGCIMANDQIIEVDGTSLTGISNQEAVEILKKTQSTVKMTIVRYLRGLRFQELQEGISQANVSSSSASNSLTNGTTSSGGDKQKTAAAKLDNGHSSSMSQHSAVSAKRRKSSSEKKRGSTPKSDFPLIDLASEPNDRNYGVTPAEAETSLMEKSSDKLSKVQSNHVSFSPQTVIPPPHSGVNCELRKKWEAILGDKVDVLVAKVSKPDQASGLGISLEGTVEVEEGRELRPRHYIRSILPDGPVDKEGTLRSGDELLQVNDNRLKDLFHEEVVSNLRQLPAPSVTLVCARRKVGGGGDDNDEQVFSPSPIRGTIVNNVDTGKSRQAFASRVS